MDSATLAALHNSAYQLDEKFTTSLLQEYNKTVRYIKSLAPQDEGEEEDPLLSPTD